MRIIEIWDWKVAMLAFACFHAPRAIADTGAIDDREKVINVSAAYGLSTFKSLANEMNDTGSTMIVKAGVQAGSELKLGINLNYQSNSCAFALNETAFASTVQDIAVDYRFGYLRVGGVLSSQNLIFTTASEERANLSVTAFGGTMNLLIPVDRSAITHIDVLFLTGMETTDAVEAEATNTYDSRMMVNIGGDILITKKLVNMIFGYRYDSYAVTLGGTSYQELITSTYVGLGMAFNF